MTVCECGKQYISLKMFEAHRLKVHGTLRAEEVPQPPAEPEKIVLHFSKSVEVIINGQSYEGKDIEVPNYSVAADVARIAREAYGNEILL